MKSLRIAYLSSHDPRDKKVWSGSHYSIYRSLCSLGEVDILGPYEPGLLRLWLQVKNQLSLKLRGKRIDYRHGIALSKAYANYFGPKLNSGKYDLAVAPAASSELAHIETRTPVVYITDGTFAGCLNYHLSLRDLTPDSIAEGNEVERKAISNCRHLIVSSEWAAKSAVKDYQCDPKKVHILPFGANLEDIPEKIGIPQENPKIWRLLFAGVYWGDKGGEIAHRCFKMLVDKGYDVELTVLGCIPPPGFEHPRMKVIPFIDKNSPGGQKKLSEIFAAHHFLILPTRFDCTPIVINESSAFGVPCLLPRTGGVEGHLKEGVNGFLHEYNDPGEGYFKSIEKMIQDPAAYVALRKSTRELYERELNWKSWTEKFRKITGI